MWVHGADPKPRAQLHHQHYQNLYEKISSLETSKLETSSSEKVSFKNVEFVNACLVWPFWATVYMQTMGVCSKYSTLPLLLERLKKA